MGRVWQQPFPEPRKDKSEDGTAGSADMSQRKGCFQQVSVPLPRCVGEHSVPL